MPAGADENRIVFPHLVLAFGANIAPTLFFTHFLGPANSSAFRATHNVFGKSSLPIPSSQSEVTLVITNGAGSSVTENRELGGYFCNLLQKWK